MVQYKRKPVQYLPEPLLLDESVEVWYIKETGEVFPDYESYLGRRDFYNQTKFTCEITGHSSMTFWDARKSELHGSRAVDSSFPEALREPVLRKVQFSTISRIDELVNFVFDEFREDFFPREHVILIKNSQKIDCVVRTKSEGFTTLRDGSFAPHLSYTLTPIGTDQEISVDQKDISRDRKVFTKQMLRSFLKHNISREQWAGAPWLVKEDVAKTFNIDTRIPPQLNHEAIIAQKKAELAMKKQGDHGTFLQFITSQHPQYTTHPGQPINFDNQPPKYRTHTKDGQPKPLHVIQYQQIPQNGQLPPQYLPPPNHTPTINPRYGHDLNYMQTYMPLANQGAGQLPSHNHAHSHGTFPARVQTPTQHMQMPVQVQLQPKPIPIKYPIEDLDLAPRPNMSSRPKLKFFTEDVPGVEKGALPPNSIRMDLMGPLLEVWNTLNVHADVYLLDSFTLDDFAEALKFQSDEVDCELLNEVHCAVLKQIIDDKGAIQLVGKSLPQFPAADDEDEEEEEDESKEPTPEPTPEPPRRTTRSSLAKSEAAAIKEKTPTPEPEDKAIHLAADMLADNDWTERLKARDFKAGGWQTILVGLLYQLSLDETKKDICENILAELAPVDKEPEQETARVQYAHMDVNLRIEALQLITILSVGTRGIREYLDSSMADMTSIRKDKIDQQRLKKQLHEELRSLDDQRKILAPENQSPEPEAKPEINGTANGDVSMTDVAKECENSSGRASSPLASEEEEDEGPRNGRTLRRANERKRKREKEVAKKEKEKKEKEAAKLSKTSKQWQKVLRDIEKKQQQIRDAEEKIMDYDNDLRETNVQRTKVLGRDRYWNRYWWFERNGMPYGGVPGSSTEAYGYANGRLWVQGPDDNERLGFIELDDDWNMESVNRYGMTITERKEKEYGPTDVRTAHQWGYIDEPEALDQLIGWLDDRGEREKALRRELLTWKDKITPCMAAMKDHMKEVVVKKEAAVEEQATRVSTRNKTYVDVDSSKAQCLAWSNYRAYEQLGHAHMEQPRPRKQKKLKNDTEKIPLGKGGKPLTRQGTRYGFK